MASAGMSASEEAFRRSKEWHGESVFISVFSSQVGNHHDDEPLKTQGSRTIDYREEHWIDGRHPQID